MLRIDLQYLFQYQALRNTIWIKKTILRQLLASILMMMKDLARQTKFSVQNVFNLKKKFSEQVQCNNVNVGCYTYLHELKQR